MQKFSSKVSERLKFYVYLYVDPRTEVPFYIGKGKGNRCFAHLHDKRESEKVRHIEELRKLGLQPRIELLKYGLTEKESLLVESTAIDLLDVTSLTNASRGHGSRFDSRAPVEEIVATLDAKQVRIKEPAILININKAYRFGLTAVELYDFTRSAWKVGPKRTQAKYALSIYRGVIREVYEIAAWVPGRATMRSADQEHVPDYENGRWEFVGKIANDSLRNQYIGRSVAHYFKPGAQNPIMYVNCVNQ
jgi:hypothetical protein